MDRADSLWFVIVENKSLSGCWSCAEQQRLHWNTLKRDQYSVKTFFPFAAEVIRSQELMHRMLTDLASTDQ